MVSARTAVSDAGPAVAREPAPIAACGSAERARDLPGVTFSLVSTPADFAALEDDWNGLFARAGQSHQVFQQFAWCHHWVEHFVSTFGGGQLTVVTARRNGTLVMVWPLVSARVAGLTEIAWLGEPVSQYGDVLVEDGPGRHALLVAGWRYLLVNVRADVVRLNKVRDDSAVSPLLVHIRAVITQRMAAPFLDLANAPTWAAYEARHSAKARKNRRRLFRRLEETGAVLITSHGAGLDAQRLAHEAIVLKRAWLADKGLLSPAIADARTLAFFEAVAADTKRTVGIRVTELSCGGETAAVEIGFGCKDRMAVHIIVYAAAFEKAGAGGLLMEACMEKSHASGFAVHDMLAPGGGYKTEWADAEAGVSDYAVPVSLPGRVYVHGYLGVVRPRLKVAACMASRWVRSRRRTSTAFGG